jgi:hypothetical protein
MCSLHPQNATQAQASVREKLNKVYAVEPSTIDAALVRAQVAAICRQKRIDRAGDWRRLVCV